MKNKLSLPPVRRGFDFADTEFRAFSDEGMFRQALHDQSASTALQSCAALEGVSIDGTAHGMGVRLTKAAFGQLCHASGLPVAYVEALARRDEQLALDIVMEAVQSGLRRKAPKSLVVNTATGIASALVDTDGYELISNETILDLALSSGRNIELNRGYLEGPNARITVVDPSRTLEPRLGDVIQIGTELTTNVGADSLIVAQSYNERLRCLNGMVVRDKAYGESFNAKTGTVDDLPAMILRTVASGERVGPLMRAGARQILDEDGIVRITRYLGSEQNGGGRKLLAHAIDGAQREARAEGRDDAELTVWNFANAVTDAAKSAPSLTRQAELESLGFKVLRDFVVLSK